MGLPEKGLRYKKLKRLTAGPVVPKSGHIVEKVTFIDLDGEEKLGFYKPLDSTYPELLAKLSVTSSIFARLSLGERAAEDRLVFDDKDNLVGTLSIAIKDFKPLNFIHDPGPSIPAEKEKVIPSTQTLLEHNVIELLVTSWFLGNDDLHPGNISLKGIIDWDMYLYWITVHIKGPRIINGTITDTPPKGINITQRDFENFPYVQEANFTHWPTKYIPANYNYAKAYPQVKSFIELARNPLLHNGKDPISAQDQLFTAVLKILLTHQPEVLRKRLNQYFGDLPLDARSLDPSTLSAIQTSNPKLFISKETNTETNICSYVDFAMALYQLYYDALYRTTVFYKGCEKNGQGQFEPLFLGVAVPSFCGMLHAKPSMYQNIKKWIIKQNQHLPASCQFNVKQLEQRYHQIFRDALVPDMKEYLHLSSDLALELQKVQSLGSFLPIEAEINPSDSNVTESLSLFKHLHPLDINGVDKALDCDKQSDLRKGTIKLVEFNNDLIQYVNEYFGKQHTILTRKDNEDFIKKITKLINKYRAPIMSFLEKTSWKTKFASIIQDLQAFCISAEFGLRIDSYDGTITNYSTQRRNSENKIPEHTENEVVQYCIKNLFDWVNKIPPSQFQKYVENIIEDKYSSKLNWYRQREVSVKNYLNCSGKQSGADRLAYILCSGTAETGALNKALIKNFIMLMLKENIQVLDVYCPSVEKALEIKEFDKDLYTTKAIEYAKSAERFTHLCMNSAFSLINETLFDWVNQLSDASFRGIVFSAVNHHESNKSYLTPSRKAEVRACLQSNLSTSKKLASILSNRGWENNSLNTFLYKGILYQMRIEAQDKPQLTKSDQLILQLFDEHLTKNYFDMVVEFCKLRLKEVDHVYGERPALMF